MRRSETISAAAACATRLQAEARAAGYRRLIMISGEARWGRRVAEAMLAAAYGSLHEVLWAALAPPPSTRPCAPDGLVQVLGSEAAALVLDTHDGLDPDGLGAGMGTVRAGGLVLVLTPPLADWPGTTDPQAQRLAVDGWGIEAVGHRFIQRLQRVLTADPLTVIIEQSGPTPEPQPLPVGVQGPVPNDPDCVTSDQAQAVDAVLRAATGHRRRPTVLTADRGRGKSAALGIAAARYLQSRGGTVVVTGPRRAAVEAVLRHAALCLGQSIRRARVDAGGGASIRFLLPEEIARCEPAPALVLVDEAAALSAALLGDLLRRYSRIVFATTIHGYEGTGRGFVLRFQPTLETESPRWRHVALREPIRWRAGDPVEALVFRALLLDAELPAIDAPRVAPQQTRLQIVDRDALARDEPLLRDVFGLLIHAHYRTRPLDLRNLLDGPN
uniref:tRNA(Met) cytidine acetyltransferase TmcA domain-containing protein n=1 Tax=Aquisalimonas sp. TaxID=1872621 RepID=UPI0025C360EE